MATEIIQDCSTGETIEREMVPLPLPAEKQAMRARITVLAASVYIGGVTVQGNVFASDPASRLELAEAALAATIAQLNNEAFTADIELKNGTVVNLSRAQTVGLAKAFRTRTAEIRAHARALIQAVNAAADHAEIEAIDIEAGW